MRCGFWPQSAADDGARAGTSRGKSSAISNHRAEGLRVKHQLKGSSIKVYDKQGSILRVETTINRLTLKTGMAVHERH